MCQRLKIPLKTGNCLKGLDFRLRGNDKLLSIYMLTRLPVPARSQAGMTENGIFRLFTRPSHLMDLYSL